MLGCMRVCRSWTAPARRVVYSSVAITSQQQALAFAQTLKECKELGSSIRQLALDPAGRNPVPVPKKAVSRAFVQVLSLAPNVRHLIIGSVHDYVRQDLRRYLLTSRVECLIYDVSGEMENDIRAVFKISDLPWILSLPNLRHVDFRVPWRRLTDYNHRVPRAGPPPSLRASAHITRLSLILLNPAVLLAIVSAVSHTVELVCIKTEVRLEPIESLAAWAPTRDTLRGLDYHETNATTEELAWGEERRWLERFLPQCKRLECFSAVLNTSVSGAVLSLVPPSVHLVQLVNVGEPCAELVQEWAVESLGWKGRSSVKRAVLAWCTEADEFEVNPGDLKLLRNLGLEIDIVDKELREDELFGLW